MISESEASCQACQHVTSKHPCIISLAFLDHLLTVLVVAGWLARLQKHRRGSEVKQLTIWSFALHTASPGSSPLWWDSSHAVWNWPVFCQRWSGWSNEYTEWMTPHAEVRLVEEEHPKSVSSRGHWLKLLSLDMSRCHTYNYILSTPDEDCHLVQPIASNLTFLMAMAGELSWRCCFFFPLQPRCVFLQIFSGKKLWWLQSNQLFSGVNKVTVCLLSPAEWTQYLHNK